MHGPITEAAVGSTLTVGELCKATVEVSDNPAANILIREMGGLEVFQAWYRSIGDQVTRVDRYEIALNSAMPDDPRDTTTPIQFVTNLDVVMQGDLLSSKHLALLTKWLTETPTGTSPIKAGVPADYRVAHKTGTGDFNSHNNIGEIWPPSVTVKYRPDLITFLPVASSRPAPGGSETCLSLWLDADITRSRRQQPIGLRVTKIATLDPVHTPPPCMMALISKCG